jgi:hypothetical protein
MPDGRKESRIREIDRRVAELDALLDPSLVRGNKNGNGAYWSQHQLERNTLLAERYRLTKKSA